MSRLFFNRTHTQGPEEGKKVTRVSILSLNLSAQGPGVSMPRHAPLSQSLVLVNYLCDLGLPILPNLASCSANLHILPLHSPVNPTYQPGGHSVQLQHAFVFFLSHCCFLSFLKTNPIFLSFLFATCPQMYLGCSSVSSLENLIFSSLGYL